MSKKPSQDKIDEAIKSIESRLKIFYWFHYARWVEEAGRIGIFCGPKRTKKEYSQVTAPPAKEIRELLGDFTKVPFGILHMD